MRSRRRRNGRVWMNSGLAVRQRGAQRPRIQHLPQGRVRSSGPEVVELAALAGLELDEWQAWVLDHALAERSDGIWCASEVGLIVPRQNGKGSILEALELAALFLFDLKVTIHSAHEYKTAAEHYLRISELIRNCPQLHNEVAHYYTANGNRAIVLHNGNRLIFAARSGGSGRGFTGDLIVLDEAYELTFSEMGAMGPTLLTRRGRQVWYTSSAPKVTSEKLHDVRNKGIAGSAPRLCFFEWGNDPGLTVGDWDKIVEANPGYGIRVDDEGLNDLRSMLGDDEFLRESGGVPSMPDGGAQIFGPGNWEACKDTRGQICGKPALALDVAPDMAGAAFAVSGLRDDGLPQIEIPKPEAAGPGTGWVVREALAAKELWPVWLDPRSPAGGLIHDLQDAGVEIAELPAGELPRACAALQHAVMNHKVRHRGQPPLDASVNGAAVRTAGNSWVWAPLTSSVDISPLGAGTVALWAATQAPAPNTELIVI